MAVRSRGGTVLVLLLTLLVVHGAALAQEGPPALSPEQVEAMTARAAELGLPEGTMNITPCVPGMGEHWANPADMPLGPIYGVVGDEVVFVELMPSQEAFANGESWLEALVPPGGQTIDHVDFEFMEVGHEGYEVPHYDIHAYFVGHQEHLAYCPPG